MGAVAPPAPMLGTACFSKPSLPPVFKYKGEELGDWVICYDVGRQRIDMGGGGGLMKDHNIMSIQTKEPKVFTPIFRTLGMHQCEI